MGRGAVAGGARRATRYAGVLDRDPASACSSRRPSSIMRKMPGSTPSFGDAPGAAPKPTAASASWPVPEGDAVSSFATARSGHPDHPARATIPMHPAVRRCHREFLLETGMPAIARRYDFQWERQRFQISAVDDYLEMAFPPRVPHLPTWSSIRPPRRDRLAQGPAKHPMPNVFNFEIRLASRTTMPPMCAARSAATMICSSCSRRTSSRVRHRECDTSDPPAQAPRCHW